MIGGIGDIVSSTYSQTLNGRERGVAQLNPGAPRCREKRLRTSGPQDSDTSVESEHEWKPFNFIIIPPHKQTQHHSLISWCPTSTYIYVEDSDLISITC